MPLPENVTIREVGAREGFQTLPQVVPTEQKIALIDALSATGLRHIEVASFVRPDLMPSMADADEVTRGFRKRDGIRYTALYLNIKGFQRAESVPQLDNQGWIPIAASDTFLRRNNNVTIDERIDRIPEWIDAFHSAGRSFHGLMLSTAFGSNQEGLIPIDVVVGILDRVMDAAASRDTTLQEICLADTTGCATPERLKALVRAVRASHPAPAISLHLHDTRGAGIANVYAGLQEGIDIIDSSIGGLGGCPFAPGAAGNVCTEDIVFLCHEMGIETGIDLDACIEAAKLAESIVGATLPGKVYRAAPLRKSTV